ncbi:hypothetical protein BpHYR1_000632 [Brachionus plicatilis]|uniref:Uncharacterized protein n=1 Tax=Brachionus plicatilis TaxID=10195 RepID=A0A3M7RS71_BRAPC|nr:hypothetical protein BpHYR1_000632 [Brachionus plicatilis]
MLKYNLNFYNNTKNTKNLQPNWTKQCKTNGIKKHHKLFQNPIWLTKKCLPLLMLNWSEYLFDCYKHNYILS